MKIKEFSISGPKLIELKYHGDARGFFVERFRVDQFREAGVPHEFVQDNYSRSQANCVRGLHFQYAGPQGKLVTVCRGRILDIAVDIRVNSPTFGQHLAIELDSGVPTWFWIPAGFAHGFSVLSEEGADLMYKVDHYYNPAGEGAIFWKDKDLNIEWRLDNPILSAKDTTASSFADYKINPKF